MKPINAEEIVRVFNGWLEEADSLAEREAIECCIESCSSMTLAIMDSMAASSRTSCMVWLTTRSSSHCLRTVFFLQPFFFLAVAHL